MSLGAFDDGFTIYCPGFHGVKQVGKEDREVPKFVLLPCMPGGWWSVRS